MTTRHADLLVSAVTDAIAEAIRMIVRDELSHVLALGLENTDDLPKSETHADIINLWPTLSDFAGDIGVAYGTAKAMRRRGSIPAEHWLAAVSRAADRGINGVSLEALATAAASRTEQSV